MDHFIKVDEVFGVSSKPVKSYIERPTVDNKFVGALKTDKQIIVYGSSKQGKTALVSRHLSGKANLTVSVTPKTTAIDIYSTIIRNSGVSIKVSETLKSGEKLGGSIGTKIVAQIPTLGSIGLEAGVKGDKSDDKELKYEEIPFNLELPQDIAELLKKNQFFFNNNFRKFSLFD